MNQLFRRIKENDNLDALEESDDEEEFHDDNVNKFMNENVHYLYMQCRYDYKFGTWHPLDVVFDIDQNSATRVCYLNELNNKFKK